MVAMCAMVLPVVKTKLEIAEAMREHGAWAWCNGTARNSTDCIGTACNGTECTVAQPAINVNVQQLYDKGMIVHNSCTAKDLPSNLEEPHVTPPKWASTSIDYAPSPDARMAADPGVIFRGTQLTRGSKSSMRCKASDQGDHPWYALRKAR